MKERAIHAAMVKYLRFALPKDAICRTIPGGDGSRTMAPGYVKGTADILIVHFGKAYFLEVKGSKGKVSPAQLLEAEAVRGALAEYEVVRTLEDVEQVLLGWGMTPRFSIGKAA